MEVRIGDKVYVASYINTNFDIISPMTFVVTAPATGSWCFSPDVKTHQTLNLKITAGVALGGSPTAMVFRNLNRGGTHPEKDCDCLIERGGTYTGGTVIYDGVELRGEIGEHWQLKANTSYLVTLTTKADDNYTSICFHVCG